jgi:hypothetical protein
MKYRSKTIEAAGASAATTPGEVPTLQPDGNPRLGLLFLLEGSVSCQRQIELDG